MTNSLQTASAAAFLLLFFGGCASTASDTYSESGQPVAAAGSQEQQAAPTQNPNAVSCQSIRPTGSRIPKRICMTRHEWDERRREAQKMSDTAKQFPSAAPPEQDF